MAAINIDASKFMEINDRINAAINRMVLGTHENDENRASLKSMIRLRISRGMKKVANSVKVPANNSGLEQAVQHGAFTHNIGGSVRITDQKKKSGAKRSYVPHRPASARTKQVNQYYGVDRAFILRFLNNGTIDRISHSMDNSSIRRGSTEERPRRKSGYKGGALGYRGSIRAIGFFDAAQGTFNNETSRITADIEEMARQVLQEAFNS